MNEKLLFHMNRVPLFYSTSKVRRLCCSLLSNSSHIGKWRTLSAMNRTSQSLETWFSAVVQQGIFSEMSCYLNNIGFEISKPMSWMAWSTFLQQCLWPETCLSVKPKSNTEQDQCDGDACKEEAKGSNSHVRLTGCVPRFHNGNFIFIQTSYIHERTVSRFRMPSWTSSMPLSNNGNVDSRLVPKIKMIKLLEFADVTWTNGSKVTKIGDAR